MFSIYSVISKNNINSNAGKIVAISAAAFLIAGCFAYYIIHDSENLLSAASSTGYILTGVTLFFLIDVIRYTYIYRKKKLVSDQEPTSSSAATTSASSDPVASTPSSAATTSASSDSVASTPSSAATTSASSDSVASTPSSAATTSASSGPVASTPSSAATPSASSDSVASTPSSAATPSASSDSVASTPSSAAASSSSGPVSSTPSSAAASSSSGPVASTERFTTEQIQAWLFEGAADSNFPPSMLAETQGRRIQEACAPITTFNVIPMLGPTKYRNRIGLYNGSITDMGAYSWQRVAIGNSNSGDLLTGCGYAIATAIINAAGPNLQRDLYNRFGVPPLFGVSKFGKDHYSKTEGRGYSITCDGHDMRKSHNIERIEFMIVPMFDIAGVHNVYAEAFEHSKDLDFIALPMVGMSHPVLLNNPALSAKIAMEEFKKFVDRNPSSKLKVIFTIYNDPKAMRLYDEAAAALDSASESA